MENTVKVRRLVINHDKQGVETIALVDEPAIMLDFVKFNEEKKITYSIDEERRIIFSPVLIPFQHIPRIDKKTGEEYLVYMDRETVLLSAMKWQAEGRRLLANEMHDEEKPLNGVAWFNTTVTDEKMFSSPVGFEKAPMGTWFVAGFVHDTELWERIKSGEFKGISMEGYYDQMEPETLTDEQIQAIAESFQ